MKKIYPRRKKLLRKYFRDEIYFLEIADRPEIQDWISKLVFKKKNLDEDNREHFLEFSSATIHITNVLHEISSKKISMSEKKNTTRNARRPTASQQPYSSMKNSHSKSKERKEEKLARQLEEWNKLSK